jgi:tRNA(fMet)-specific endonuclease VapC
VLPLEPGVDRAYAEVRAALEASGRTIGANDLLIAAHALERGAVLVTGNTSEFGRVPGLEVQDWLRG